MKKTYHGWIFREETNGFKDFFSIQHQGQVTPMGYGEPGTVKSVDYFEALYGPIRLEETPLGLRVYTTKED